MNDSDAQQVCELVHRFGAAIDASDWDTCRALVTTDVRACFPEAELHGVDALVEMLATVIGSSGGTYHLFGNHIFDKPAADTGVLACYTRSDQVGRGDRAGLRYEVLARWRVVAARAEAQWRIADLEMVPVFEFGDRAVFDFGSLREPST